MSDKKGKSPLGVVLALSLDIGKTGKVVTGTWEAGWSGTGQSELVRKIAADFATLKDTLTRVGRALAPEAQPPVPETRRAPLAERFSALSGKADTLTGRTVSNAPEPREAFRRDIQAATIEAGTLESDIAAAIRKGELQDCVITHATPAQVTTGEKILLARITARASSGAPVRMVRAGKEVTEVAFDNPGGGQNFQLEAAATDTHKAASLRVAVNVVRPTRVVTWSPPKTIVWGTKLTVGSLKASATGEGLELVLTPEDGILPVGDAVELRIEAPRLLSKPSWETGVASAMVKVTPAPCNLTWVLPAKLAVTTTVTAKLLGAKLGAGDGALAVTAPAGGVFAATGPGQTVTLVAAATATHASATLTGTVEVVRGVPELSWKTPKPVVLNTKLSGTQLNPGVVPNSLRKALVFAPPADAEMTVLGAQTLKVSFPGDAKWEPAAAEVRLVVVANADQLRGGTDALAGKGWTKPVGGVAKDRLDAWEKDDGKDPKSLKMMGQRLMRELSGMTAEEIETHMTSEMGNDPQSARTDQGGVRPCVIWTFANGLQVRYKSNGDQHNPGAKMFCIEARTSGGASANLGEVAFKVSADGNPAAKGRASIDVPNGVGDDDYKTGVARATHLFCRPKDVQVITWDPPTELEAGTMLTREVHLNAVALGGVAVGYARGDGIAVAVGHKLPAGQVTALTAAAAATDRYEAGTKTVNIRVKAAPPPRKRGDKK